MVAGWSRLVTGIIAFAYLHFVSPFGMAAASVKLSPAVKALISAPHALGQAIPAPSRAAVKQLFDNVRSRGERNGVDVDSWLTVSTAALVTVNSPATICELFSYAAERQKDVQDQVKAAAIMRETALKCISFSGVSRRSVWSECG